MQSRWRNAEVFKGEWLDLQQRLKQVVYCFEDDQVMLKAEDLQIVGSSGLVGLRSYVMALGAFLFFLVKM